MITRTAAPPPSAREDSLWQADLRGAVKSVDELLDRLQLDRRQIAVLDRAEPDFPLRVPRAFVERMRPGDPDDPLLRQVLPSALEALPAPGFVDDPLREADAVTVPGLLHKYHGRVLLVVTGACAVHCRYCFRRHFPYDEHSAVAGRLEEALAYVAGRPDVEEVILSGGDPLSMADARLAPLADAIAAIPHVRRLRIHTRLPVVVPERVDDGLLGWLSRGRLHKVVVVHVNHPQEVDGEVRRAMRRLAGAGATLLNQSVLLRGVNDRVEILRDLSQALFATGVMPYYLHLIDRVRGAAHFEVDERTARELLWELAKRLPGYLVPRLVRELPGAPAKVPIFPAYGEPPDPRADGAAGGAG